jgi:hypothetical protein
MSSTIEQLHPAAAGVFLQGLEDQERQLYRIIYFSKVYPNDGDLSQFAVVKVTIHLFAKDADDADEQFKANQLEHYPVTLKVAVTPASPPVPEDSMLEVRPKMALVPQETEH